MAGRDCGEGLATPGRHLDEGTGPGVDERALQVRDGFVLDGPEFALRQFRHLPKHPAQLRRSQVLEPQQFLGAVEGEDLPAARMGVETIRELGDLSGGFVGERQRTVPCRDLLVEPLRVALRLDDHPLEGVSDRLRLDDPDRAPLGIEQVVGEPGQVFFLLLPLQPVFPDSHAQPRMDVHGVEVLDIPAAGLELPVDLLTGLLLRRQRHRDAISFDNASGTRGMPRAPARRVWARDGRGRRGGEYTDDRMTGSRDGRDDG